MSFIASRLFIVILIVAWSSLHTSCSIQNVPTRYSLKEITTVEQMWKVLFLNSTFGYTLLGNKPVSTICWPANPLQNLKTSSILENCYIHKNIDLWLNFSKEFPSYHYIFYYSQFEFENEKYHELVLINISAVNNLISKSNDAFLEYLNNSKDMKNFINSVLRSQNHELIGILLGFGKNNSFQFSLPYKVRESYKRHSTFPEIVNLTEESRQWISNSISYQDKKEKELITNNLSEKILELQNIKFVQFKSLFEDSHPFERISLPAFVISQKDQETEELYMHYSHVRKKIVDVLDTSNFIELIKNLFFYGNLDASKDNNFSPYTFPSSLE